MNINQHKPSHSVYWICWNSVIISMFQFPSNRTYSTLFFFVFFLMGADDCKTSSNQPLIKIRHYMALQTRERKTTMLHVLDEKYTQCEFFSPLTPPPLPWQSDSFVSGAWGKLSELLVPVSSTVSFVFTSLYLTRACESEGPQRKQADGVVKYSANVQNESSYELVFTFKCSNSTGKGI